MRAALLSCIVFIAIGCVPLESPGRKDAPKPSPSKESAVTKAARDAFKARDRVYAEELDALAGDVEAGNVKYDPKLKERLETAQKHAADAANPILVEVMTEEFGPKALDQPDRVAKSLRDLAAALK
jgi:hypothetical protein